MGASKSTAAVVDDGAVVSSKRLRTKGSGGIFLVRDGVWRVDVEVGRDKVTGRRRRVSRQVEGSRRDAEAALARLKVAAEQRKVTPGRASARSVRAVLDLYLEAADNGTIELAPRTLLTSRSAANTMCSTKLLDNRTFGSLQLHRLTWKEYRGDVRSYAHRRGLVGLGAPLRDGPVEGARLRPQAWPPVERVRSSSSSTHEPASRTRRRCAAAGRTTTGRRVGSADTDCLLMQCAGDETHDVAGRHQLHQRPPRDPKARSEADHRQADGAVTREIGRGKLVGERMADAQQARRFGDRQQRTNIVAERVRLDHDCHRGSR